MCAQYKSYQYVFISLFCVLLVSFSVHAEIKNGYWLVQKGDTLYAIARAIFPAQRAQQARLRQDILQLNPDISQNNVIRLEIGMQLRLPDYVPSMPAKVISPQPPPLSAAAAELGSDRWLVRSGETLYSISRKLLPGDVPKQGQLRRDIALLNPQVFRSGAQNMKVGTVLKLPDYVVASKDTVTLPASPDLPAVQEVPVISQPVPVTRAITREAEPVMQVDERMPESVSETAAVPEVAERTTVYVGRVTTDRHFSISLGLSAGGDLLAKTVGGHDITLGSGGHLRLDYESIEFAAHGYRIGLGFQYDQVLNASGGDSASLQQPYLEALYLYRFTDFIFGAGIVWHDGGQFESDISGTVTTTKFDAAAGALLMIEYVGAKNEFAIGLSHTAAEFKTTVSAAKFDAARTELYYSWRF